jgi:sec-independent protein translocase protein TatB
MPSFQDSAILVFLALLLFGPKKLPELARQLGKLMGEFRRASNEFRMQMEDELRIADQEEQRKKIAAMEAAAPVAPLLAENVIAPHPETPAPAAEVPYGEDHPHMPPPAPEPLAAEPLPIASSGDLNLMPPSTGLPVSNSALTPVLDSIPHIPDPEVNSLNGATSSATSEAPQHG